jgi:iron transport multicopper oxidase
VLVIAGVLASAGAAVADGITNSGDDLRTGWYPNAEISPEVVKGGTFGQLWSAPVDGQVYAQPLVASTPGTSSGKTVIVATENNEVYGLDSATGTQNWANHFPGTPWDPAHLGCADIKPSIGTTATPVIDPATDTVYVTHKVSAPLPDDAEWYLDALDATTGVERSGYPLLINGTADNDHSVSFNPEHEQQRPGLLLMNGVVYMGFGGHCDAPPFTGWVIGVDVSASTPHITAMWEDNSGQNGAGIWQSGVGLTSDGSNTLLVTTGNGGSPTTPTPGHTPPNTFGESVVRLNVGADGKLTPVDFFAPFDTADLDQWDADFGSGALVGLPSQYFGTTSHPHLAVAVGKEGYVYLFDRDNLGGLDQGPNGDDNTLERLGRYGGVWGRPTVWPGDDGKYIYVPTSSNASTFDVYQYVVSGSGSSAQPTLTRVATAPGTFGWGTGSPIVTSDNTNSASALVWIVWSADRTGVGAQLRAYNAIPAGGSLGTSVYQAPIGTSTNYSIPGVGNDGHLYIGTRDGHVLAFGSPVHEPVSGSVSDFPTTTVGSSSNRTLTITANEDVRVTGITSSSSQFTVGTPSSTLPATVANGGQITVPITFTPSGAGLAGGEVTVTTDSGTVSFSVSGTGQANSPLLQPSTSLVSMDGTAIGGHVTDTVTFSNVGNAPVQITTANLPKAPFRASGAPVPGTSDATIAPGGSVTVTINFDPTYAGQFSDEIEFLTQDGEDVAVGIAASAGAPGMLQFSSEHLDFGNVQVGSTASKTFTLTNTGGTAVVINKSKPPFGGDFAATTALPEGTTLAPGKTITQTVTFTPTATGPATPSSWAITGDDSSGLHQIQFTGAGVTAAGTPTTTTITTTPTHAPPGSRSTPAPKAPKVSPRVTTTVGLRHTFITYTALVARKATFAIERQVAGRRSHGRCQAATSHNRHAARCTRWVTIATFTHRDRVGANRVPLTMIAPAHRLTPGTYRVQSVLLDARGARHVFVTTLRVTAPRG